jgi:hypothetical protein
MLLAVISALCSGALAAGVGDMHDHTDVFSDTWAATDALGRVLPTHEEVGPPREGKFVGIFYFLWLGAHGQSGPHDITKILAAHPNAMEEPDNPAWGPMHKFHHWGEPLFGYYLSDDAYVLRKHAEMLADAAVDVVIFDVTNQATYKPNYMALCNVFDQARKDGVAAPQIAFLCPFWDPGKVVKELHADLYGPGHYEDLWFQWKGKPLIMADPAKVDPQFHDFFTFRKPVPSYFTGPDGPDQWGWLEVHPQHIFRNSAGEAEQMVVGVGQNAVGDRLGTLSEKGSKGRSFHNGAMDTTPGAVLRGLNFAEQWERALEVDPEFIFITGWNEWVAMRFNEFSGVKEPVMFVDQFDHEGSRDIEPMRGGHWDNYYYQMVTNIRRFKGARPQQPASAPKTILIDGDFADWADVGPEFRHHIGSTVHRDHPGWGDAGRYVNTTGRNDFVAMKVARDDGAVYFYVRTHDDITAPAMKWMMLFLNIDKNHDTGWEGYDFVVNREAPDGEGAILEGSLGGWQWETVAKVGFKVVGNQMELAIPRDALGLDSAARLDIELKWADNMQKDGDIMEFVLSGDAAPSGRFNYRYFDGE